MDLKVLIRGAGEMASGVGLRLFHSGFKVIFTEVEAPLCVRRGVSFCEALHHGRWSVEGAAAALVRQPDEIQDVWRKGMMAVIIDPELDHLESIAPDVLVDAILAKRNLGTSMNLAGLVIALGPGFTAGLDVHVVVETNRGHDLGRLIYRGQAEPNTGFPGEIGRESLRRVLRAPVDGLVESELDIGAMVQAGQVLLHVSGHPVRSELSGALRGLIRPGTLVEKGLKLGDVDPRGRPEYTFTVSDKARAVAGSVIEAVLHHYNS